MTAPARLAHYVLRTNRLPEMRDWYMTVLDMRVVAGNSKVCFLSYDEKHHRLALVGMVPLKESEHMTPGLEHVGFAYETMSELLDHYVRLEGRGIHTTCPLNHGTTTSVYYRDPDGNSIELQVDNFDTVEECNEFIDAGSWPGSPLGIPWDPDDFVERRAAGASDEDLMALVRPSVVAGRVQLASSA